MLTKYLSSQQAKTILVSQARQFAKWQPPSNRDFLTEEQIQKYQDDFENTFSKREQVFKKAERLALNEVKAENFKSDNVWFNRIKTMSDQEFELMPLSFVKKYGAFMTQW